MTNLGADVSDLYLEKINADGYLYDGRRGPSPPARRPSRSPAGRARRSPYGPRTTGRSSPTATTNCPPSARTHPSRNAAPDRGDGYAVSLRWTALNPGKSMDAVFELNRAKDWNGFRKAAAHFEVPSQNLIYADTKGNIGYQAPGRIPTRAKGVNGTYPAPGWDPKYKLDRLHPAKGPAVRVQPQARLHRHRQPGRHRRGQVPLPAHQGLGLRLAQPADQRPHRVEDQGRRQGLHGRHADLPEGQQQRDRPAADALPDEDRHQGSVRPPGPAAAGGLGLHPGARLRGRRLLQRRLAQHPQARLRQQDAQGTAGRRPVPHRPPGQ